MENIIKNIQKYKKIGSGVIGTTYAVGERV